jgi:hypothetical protein
MMNLPPPDPRSSRLGFDEFVGVVVAFAVIGTILVVSLRDKNKGFRLENLTPFLTNPQVKPDATPTPIPTGLIPQEQQATPLPTPTVLVPVTPTPQATQQTPVQKSPITTVVPVPSSVATAPTPQKTATSAPTKTVNFRDVPQVFWARPYIEALAKRGVVTGFPDNTFRPNKPITRAEFATQLQEAFDQKVVMAAPTYKDVPNKFWASSAIKETSSSGFLRGYPENTFRPNQKITKVQALVSLTKGLGLTSTSNPKQVLTVYQDAAKVPKYATDSVAIATESGFVVNYPNRQLLEPNKTITRAEAAALTYQAMVKAGKAKAITSEYVVSPQSIPQKPDVR